MPMLRPHNTLFCIIGVAGFEGGGAETTGFSFGDDGFGGEGVTTTAALAFCSTLAEVVEEAMEVSPRSPVFTLLW